MAHSKEKAQLVNAKPYVPPSIPDSVALAYQAFANGKANEGQQKLVLDWLIHVLCGTYDLSYRVGNDGDRDTSFAEGKRFVGTEVVRMTKLKVGRMTYKEETHESK